MRGAREGLLWKVPSETPKRQKVEGTNNRSQRNRAKGVECTVPNTRRAATKKGKKPPKKSQKKAQKKPQKKTTKKKPKKTTNFPTLKKIKNKNATQVSTKRRPVAWAGLCVCGAGMQHARPREKTHHCQHRDYEQDMLKSKSSKGNPVTVNRKSSLRQQFANGTHNRSHFRRGALRSQVRCRRVCAWMCQRLEVCCVCSVQRH